ncbi:Rxt3-domain-containing protein [Lentithecium fluviatile CBS 122367]|uniref:Rxt3-domain-containing protein n=1 Tax=Lentithecium fluviatile CBS 122367 TaxID=1168545 RepID=A0A6G1IKN6_9PLEO|nr:Rxt3-domain-containing protein [Lentithecium fluviatile CBS 122367]
MSSSQNAANQSPYGYGDSRRRSLSGASPPNPYGAAPSHDPPPPPSFARQHMPPPSSPQQQQQHHSHASQAQRAPYSSAFGGSRDLPGLGQAHRPGSSMSISSLIGGGDTGASAQTSQSQSSPPTNAPPSNNHSMQPPSPRRGLPSASRPEFQPYRRQPSPDRHIYGSSTSRAPEGPSYTAGSPTRAYSHQGSPDQGRSSLSQTSQPYKPMVFQGQRPYAASPHDAHARDSRQPPSSMPPRPNSEPNGPNQPEQDARNMHDTAGQGRAQHGQPEERRRTLGESHHARPNAAELLGGTSSSSSDRDRPSTVQPVSHSLFSPPRDQRSAMGPSPASRNPWRQPIPEDAPRESTETRRDEPPSLYRGYGGYSAPPQGPSPYGGPGPEDMVRGRSLDHLNQRVASQYHAPPTSDPHSAERQKSEQLSRSLSSGGGAYPGRSMYDQPRRLEDMHNAKSLLSFGPDVNRRTGRASPLPQAVQGAQAQPLSIGKDPHVKSEFGRMFSGLGGLGSSTPSRGSPMPQNAQESFPPGTDLNDHLRLQRVSSQNGRKPKRVKDEDGAFDNESMDGRGTPLGAPGAKRNKHTHPGHHHHHAHTHHHHHHHHKHDEEAPPANSTSFGGRNANLPPNGAQQPSHHHHHYHGAPHHHHHTPRPTQPALPSPKLVPKTHDIQDVLDEATKFPRRHLGSHLYEATTELPKPNSSLDDQFGYASRPKQLPRFETNPINCTFTIRVPRFHLKPRQRQQIVLQRHLWGARIYRDDSDPIAAAIHSGWIRGEWDETVDVNMLDPRITAPNDPFDAEDTLTKLPAAPVAPPADMDLQIDILILPRIQEYAGTVEYGISSRKSKTHDGLSFMIHKIRWVEEGIGSRGQERTAAAMKRRLDASATLLSLQSSGDDPLRGVNAPHDPLALNSNSVCK